MTQPVKALLVSSDNPKVSGLLGRQGDLMYGVGMRCIFDGLMTSVVEKVVCLGHRLEVYTHNSRYVFELSRQG